jgi:hypothetical protein
VVVVVGVCCKPRGLLFGVCGCGVVAILDVLFKLSYVISSHLRCFGAWLALVVANKKDGGSWKRVYNISRWV